MSPLSHELAAMRAGDRTAQEMLFNGAFVVQINDAEITATDGVADGAVQFWTESGVLKWKVFSREVGAWLTPS